jgi:hypothetical protein
MVRDASLRDAPHHEAEQTAADLAKWERKALECGLGEKGKSRVV